MTRKAILLICIIIVVILSSIILMVPYISNYIEFCKNKEKVICYLDEHYDAEIQLIKTKIGERAWPASRQEDEFIFYDITNDIYFQILCGEDAIYDYYSEAYNGKELSDKVTSRFPKEEFRYYIRCYGEKNSSYDAMNCQLFILVDNHNDLSNPYSILSFMKNEFPNLNLKLIVSPSSEEKQIVSLVQYKEIISIDAIQNFYNKELVLSQDLFSDYESFKELLLS